MRSRAFCGAPPRPPVLLRVIRVGRGCEGRQKPSDDIVQIAFDAGSGFNADPASNAICTMSSDGFCRPSQPLPTLITLSKTGGLGGAPQKALLRIADLDVTEYQTLASNAIPMHLVGFNAKLLRDQAGNNLYVTTNSITLGGGESLDVILDSAEVPTGTYFLYTPQLDHLSNDNENFGGLMTEVVVVP